MNINMNSIVSVFFQQVNGVIQNTGHGVVFRVDTGQHSPVVNISGGPLSYSYRVQEIHLHFGRTDGQGSEHRVGSHAFPAEVDLFQNFKVEHKYAYVM
ncbi:hypothetical protein AVEN_119808-1 [Araneus ventricosus]|uniref:Alpha-carbonic anhydrase domain-containing protein n=1 Tax=Araneus ventricosus TaxID=182803 RepID=A0A4Y2RN31_ARAVE|nr:hypothetical protein AVEN_103374-1 [Araneus ventricosus]GBN76554.1 hypothetical protein AVEN_64396-1 [Araneus ventricosus]GBN76810.1 hypothetical protein AVEN_75208-1 [Araneus ventricosus]GBN76812.1 hypothetical protein AVEN_119808-1 [Araneus ventricosus]